MLHGHAWRYGSNVDTGEIIASEYTKMTDPKELVKHTFEGIDPQFLHKVHEGDFIIAQENFGCGSSREAAPVVLKEAGICAVAAQSFGRIFYRNAINIGLPLIECKDPDMLLIQDGETVDIDISSGTIKAQSGVCVKGTSLPDFLIAIIKAGGLVSYKQMQIKQDDKSEEHNERAGNSVPTGE